MNKDQQRQNLGIVVAKALRDDKFKEEFIKNPRKVLVDAGVYPPEGVEIVVVENSPNRINLILPSLPLPSAPTFEDMESIESRNGPLFAATPKDKGCCGGGSSIAATWLEDDSDEVSPETFISEQLMTK